MNYFQKSLLILMGLGTCVLSNSSFATTWVADKQWGDQVPGRAQGFHYKDLYAEFMGKAKKDIFHIDLDCKQAVYGFPGYFSCMNGLPYKILGGKVSNESGPSFGGSTGEAKCQQFVSYIKNSGVSIKSLSEDDTYPIKVDRKYVRGGTVLVLRAGEGINHSMTLRTVDSTGTIDAIYGTDEAAERKGTTSHTLITREGLDPNFAKPYVEGADGLRAWKFMVDSNKDYHNEPDYDANDQYPGRNPNLLQITDRDWSEGGRQFREVWAQAVQRRLQIYTGEAIDDIRRLERVACEQFREVRKNIVSKGEVWLQDQCFGLSRMGGNRNFEIYRDSDAWNRTSTPSRDSQFRDTFEELETDLKKYGSADDSQAIAIRKEKKQFFDSCIAQYGSEEYQQLSLSDFEILMGENKVKSNPNSSLDAKWGMAEDNESLSTCEKHETSESSKLLTSQNMGYPIQSRTVKRSR